MEKLIFYYFTEERFGLKILRERRLKISDILALNDPFDFLSVAGPTKASRQTLREWRETMAKDTGLICFSRNWQSPVQWAHYADDHKGMALGFEISAESLRQICYVQSRPLWPSTKPPWSQAVQQWIVDQLLYTKFTHWSYEDEYRLFTEKANREEDGNYYLNFSSNLQLRKVLVGDRCPCTRLTLTDALGPSAAEVEVFKVRPSFQEFRMVKQKAVEKWE